jgi:hypothetical protein
MNKRNVLAATVLSRQLAGTGGGRLRHFELIHYDRRIRHAAADFARAGARRSAI